MTQAGDFLFVPLEPRGWQSWEERLSELLDIDVLCPTCLWSELCVMPDRKRDNSHQIPPGRLTDCGKLVGLKNISLLALMRQARVWQDFWEVRKRKYGPVNRKHVECQGQSSSLLRY